MQLNSFRWLILLLFFIQPVAFAAAQTHLSGNDGEKSANKVNYIDSSLPSTPAIWHTERAGEADEQRNNETQLSKNSNKISQLSNKSNEATEVSAADKGLIDAQINDVLSSAEFIALEQSAEFSTGDKQSEQRNKGDTSDPEFLLNQLDESDLMDYVAEDDLWKEQLTIEDEP